MTLISIEQAVRISDYTDYNLGKAYDKVGFPEIHRTRGNHRRLHIDEVHALRDALFMLGKHNLFQAAQAAQLALQDPTSGQHIRRAFLGFDEQSAAETMERAFKGLGLRSAVEDSLIKAIEVLAGIEGATDATVNYAIRWANGWLTSMQRVVTAPIRDDQPHVMIVDASNSSEPESLHVLGLDLLLRQAGSRVINLGVEAKHDSVIRAIRAIQPNVIVLAGRHMSTDEICRFKSAVCTTRAETTEVQPPSFVQFRVRRQASVSSIMPKLSETPGLACDELFALYDRKHAQKRRSASTERQSLVSLPATQSAVPVAAKA